MKGNSFFVALSFLTRIPPPPWVFREGEVLFARSFLFFPVVGMILGTATAGLLFTLRGVFSPTLSGFMVTGAVVWLTRALHLDGLADWADALGGGYTAQRRREIMKDSRIGSFGAIALVIVLGVKALSLGELQAEGEWSAVVMAFAFSRFSMVLLAWKAPPSHSAPGLGARFIAGFSPSWMFIAALWLIPLAVLHLPLFLLSCATTTALCYALRRSFIRSFGQLSGDLFGATCEIVETAVLLSSLALHGALS